MNAPEFDVFLSYNSADRIAVEDLAGKLDDAGIKCWLDCWHLVAGEAWQPAALAALGKSASCAVCIGPSGIGRWQNEEMQAAINQRVESSNDAFRAIPVLLPGGQRAEPGQLPSFLTNATWVQFYESLNEEDGLHRLKMGIRGESPGRRADDVPIPDRPPYPGLRPFERADAPFFRGRDAEIDRLLHWLRQDFATPRENRLLAILGASGSGKSSLVKAGLIPAIKDDALPGSRHWPIIECRPGEYPLENLAIALAGDETLQPKLGTVGTLIDDFGKSDRTLHRLAGAALDQRADQRLVVLVDQFEELFNETLEEADRQAFLGNLLEAVAARDGHVIVILTMRVDFYDRCSDYPRLAAAIPGHQLLVPAMTDPQYREAITFPAQRVGCEVESGLVESLLRDVADQSGALPLLQHAMREVWNRRQGRVLTCRAYNDVGGIRGSLDTRASAVFDQFTLAERQVCRQLLVQLVKVGRGAPDTKRRLPFNELVAAADDSDTARRVITRLADERLLTLDAEPTKGPPTAELAHEALIHCWSTLHEIVEAQREDLEARERLREQVALWTQHGRHPDFLWSAAPLFHAVDLSRQAGANFSPDENDFILASVREKHVQEVLTAETHRVADLIEGMEPIAPLAREMFTNAFTESASNSRERLHAALALLSADETQVVFLTERLLEANLNELRVIVEALRDYCDQASDTLWRVMRDTTKSPLRQFRAGLALASFDPPADTNGHTSWNDCAEFLAGQLIDAIIRNNSESAALREAIEPLHGLLIEPLAHMTRHEQQPVRRSWATDVLASFAAEAPDTLLDVIGDADAAQFPVLFIRLNEHNEQAVALATDRLREVPTDDASEGEKERIATRTVNVAATLFRLGCPEPVWPLFRHAPDPRMRSHLVHALLARLDDEGDISAQRALWICLGQFSEEQLPTAIRGQLIPRLIELFQQHPDAGLHASVEWLLRTWGQGDQLPTLRAVLQENEQQLLARQASDPRNWYVNCQDHAMTIIQGGSFLMGSPESDPDRDVDEKQHPKRIDRRFAIGATSVTRRQYEAFQTESNDAQMDLVNNEQIRAVVRTDQSPITGVTWFEAAAYCNWLSQKEGIPEDQWCYKPKFWRRYVAGMRPKADYLDLVGYRLPSEAEWEFACRSGALTRRFYGHSDSLLGKYAVYEATSAGHTWPVGSLEPNDYGLFDMHGNVWNWCHDRQSRHGVDERDTGDEEPAGDGKGRVLRGGSFNSPARNVRAARRYPDQPVNRDFDVGFRVARTYG